jgi:hypothetical protein
MLLAARDLLALKHVGYLIAFDRRPTYGFRTAYPASMAGGAKQAHSLILLLLTLKYVECAVSWLYAVLLTLVR